jgi:hypothetical protein
MIDAAMRYLQVVWAVEVKAVKYPASLESMGGHEVLWLLKQGRVVATGRRRVVVLYWWCEERLVAPEAIGNSKVGRKINSSKSNGVERDNCC